MGKRWFEPQSDFKFPVHQLISDSMSECNKRKRQSLEREPVACGQESGKVDDPQLRAKKRGRGDFHTNTNAKKSDVDQAAEISVQLPSPTSL